MGFPRIALLENPVIFRRARSDPRGQVPLFPFGYGLSYTTFSYSGLQVRPAGDGATVTVTVADTGRRAGAAVPQLYLTDPAAAGEPPFQLRGFQKITLDPGQSGQVTFHLSRQDMSYYQTATSSWVTAPGWYQVSIGSSERDLELSAVFRTS
jgi:beta-glucosidase